MQRTAYSYGQPVTAEEVEYVINTCVKQRRRGVAPAKLFRALHALNSNLTEHIVNKRRGLAFDSGEDGFSHRRIN